MHEQVEEEEKQGQAVVRDSASRNHGSLLIVRSSSQRSIARNSLRGYERIPRYSAGQSTHKGPALRSLTSSTHSLHSTPELSCHQLAYVGFLCSTLERLKSFRGGFEDFLTAATVQSSTPWSAWQGLASMFKNR